MALLIALVLASSPVADGKATRYNPGVMEEVVENRIKWGQLDLSRGYDGYIAVADCKLLDERAVIEWPTGRWSGPHLIADCGSDKDQSYLSDIDFAVDLSYDLAVRYGVIDAPVAGVRVWLYNDFFPLEKYGNKIQ